MTPQDASSCRKSWDQNVRGVKDVIELVKPYQCRPTKADNAIQGLNIFQGDMTIQGIEYGMSTFGETFNVWPTSYNGKGKPSIMALFIEFKDLASAQKMLQAAE